MGASIALRDDIVFAQDVERDAHALDQPAGLFSPCVLGLAGASCAAFLFTVLWSCSAAWLQEPCRPLALPLGCLVGCSALYFAGQRTSKTLTVGAAFIALVGCLAAEVATSACLFAGQAEYNPIAICGAFLWPDVAWSVLAERLSWFDGLRLLGAAMVAARCSLRANG